jgi:hypothetical protein
VHNSAWIYAQHLFTSFADGFVGILEVSYICGVGPRVTAEAYLLFTWEICHIVVPFWFF